MTIRTTTVGEISEGDTVRIWGKPTVVTLVEPYGDTATAYEFVDGGGLRHRTIERSTNRIAFYLAPFGDI